MTAATGWRRALLPLLVFAGLLAVLGAGLGLNPRELPSALLDKPAPLFMLPRLSDPGKSLAATDLRGQVWLLNVWASWCSACRQEHPLLVDLARSGELKLYGLNYKDRRDAGLDWLKAHGDPYLESLADVDGRVGMDFGVYGVPETFVIDRQGVVRYKHVGPLTDQVMRDRVLPLVRALEAADRG